MPWNEFNAGKPFPSPTSYFEPGLQAIAERYGVKKIYTANDEDEILITVHFGNGKGASKRFNFHPVFYPMEFENWLRYLTFWDRQREKTRNFRRHLHDARTRYFY